MMLDLQESDLPGINYRVVEQLSVEGIIEETMKPEILRSVLVTYNPRAAETNLHDVSSIYRDIYYAKYYGLGAGEKMK